MDDIPIAGPSRDSLPLYLINGVATIWDAQTVAILHCTHGISGLRAGTLPGVSQQNAFLGLPMTLMKEETAYLVNAGIAHLIPVQSTPILPTPGIVAQRTEARIARIREQEARIQKAAKEKSEESRRAYEKGGEKARAKREARARAKAEKQAVVQSGEKEDGELFGDERDQAALLEQPEGLASPSSAAQVQTNSPADDTPRKGKNKGTTSIPNNPVFNSQGHFHTVPPTPLFPHLALSSSTPITSLPHALFPFPSSARDRALIGVFTELALRDYRMGLGPRFGGEYLIYPGDYLRYHAHFTSQVIVRDEPIKPTEIVAWGRLGTGTKKAGLICCWDDGLQAASVDGEETAEVGKGDVEFYSLEWANFG